MSMKVGTPVMFQDERFRVLRVYEGCYVIDNANNYPMVVLPHELTEGWS